MFVSRWEWSGSAFLAFSNELATLIGPLRVSFISADYWDTIIVMLPLLTMPMYIFPINSWKFERGGRLCLLVTQYATNKQCQLSVSMKRVPKEGSVFTFRSKEHKNDIFHVVLSGYSLLLSLAYLIYRFIHSNFPGRPTAFYNFWKESSLLGVSQAVVYLPACA